MDEAMGNGRKVTQDDVAERAGVSRSVVSYVLNDGSRAVAPETRDKILKAIEELGYRPNKNAQRLMRDQADGAAYRQFGIVMHDIFMFNRPYYTEILAGIHQEAHDHNHHIRFLRIFDDLKNPVLFNELIHEEEVSGLILLALNQSLKTDRDRRMVEQIQKRIRNIVCVEWEWPGLPSVNFNRQEAAYKAAMHLASLGKRRIVYLGPMDGRVLGYQQAALEAGLDLLPPIGVDPANMADGYREAARILAMADKPDAVLAGCDDVAIGALRLFRERGVAVPGALALASIDNIAVAAYADPPLTSVHVEKNDMGRHAVQILMNRAANPNLIVASVLLPTRLVVRASCGAAAGAGDPD
jgi:LacI family transcriptional regulator